MLEVSVSLAIGGGPGAYGSNVSGYTNQNILTFSDDVFVTKGKHALKFGALINHYEAGLYSPYFAQRRH